MLVRGKTRRRLIYVAETLIMRPVLVGKWWSNGIASPVCRMPIDLLNKIKFFVIILLKIKRGTVQANFSID